ncbi:PAS domain S-box protein [uncultured Desulfuromonas sp.]|uniref:PAS domain S-box protein n=1 Tax=uncultured Desulfuromonas sp. TaxID=181013 RepID=UPI00263564FB|nr:PAS domain S-box protein [uncultured Desulfuromonas sp.]
MTSRFWAGKMPGLGTALALLPGVLLFVLLLPAVSAAQGRSVFILHSYHPGLRWTDGIMAGVQEAFAESGQDIQLHVDYLDAKRYHAPEYFANFVDGILPYKLANLSFDLVLVSDNDAFDFALKHRDDLFAGAPIVFCGVNGFRPEMIAGIGGIAGITEEPAVAETVGVALRLHPGTEEVIVVGETGSVTGRQIDAQVREALASLDDGVRLSFWNDVPLEELRERARALPAGRLLLLTSVLKDRTGRVYSYAGSARRLRKVASVPFYGLWDFYLGEGIVGGKLISGHSQGRLAARLALRILGGEAVDAIPVTRSEANEYMFDYRELERFGVDLQTLPPGSHVLHRPTAFYTVSKPYFWTALATFAGLVAFLIVLVLNILLRRRSAREIESLARFPRENTNPVLRIAADGTLLYANRAGSEIQGCLGGGVGEPVAGRWRRLVEELLAGGESREVEVLRGEAVFNFDWVPVAGAGYVNLYGKDVTERKRAEAALRESEDRFRSIFQTAAAGMSLITPEGRFLQVNPALCRFLGYAEEELEGKTVEALTHPEDREATRRHYGEISSGRRQHLEYEKRYLRKDGGVVWGQASVACVMTPEMKPLFCVALVQDVTERRRAEEALRESQTKFRALFEQSFHFIGLLRPDGTLVEVNRTALEFIGVGSGEALGRPFWETPWWAHSSREQERLRRAVERAAQGEYVRYEVSHPDAAGRMHAIDFSIKPLVDEAGRVSLLIPEGRDITEYKRNVEALRESEERFRTLVEQAADGFLLHNLQGQVLDVNRQLCRMLGFSHEELVRMTLGDLQEGLSMPRAERVWRRMVPGVPASFEGRARRKDGTSFPFEGRICLIDSWGETLASVLVRDVTERWQAEKRLKEALIEAQAARERVAAIIRSVADGLIVTDGDNRIILMNRAAEDLLGIDFKLAHLQPIATVLPEAALRDHIARAQASSSEPLSEELEMTDRRLGEVRFIQVRTSQVQVQSGIPGGVISLLRDVTREREIDRMKSEFISVAAHELRTPLTSVLGYAGLLLDEEQSGGFEPRQRREFLSYIHGKGEELKRIIDDLLNLSRIESGRVLVLKRSPCDLAALLGEVILHHRKEAPRHDFQIEVPPSSLVANIDRGKMHQVLDNILGNAVKYSPAGGAVRVFLRREGSEAVVAVEDEGVGMTSDQVAKVFEKFYRADTSDSSIAGIGLGMTIVQGIVAAHGGRIWVESEQGEGTRVTFTLPLAAGGENGGGGK